jgi:hypothetical protein
MSFRVIFTSDHEIHGSGRGDPRELMVEPTDRMLRQFDAHGAKLTIFADAAEILRFKDYAEREGRDRFHYHAIVEQLQRALRTGHDVQLHLHSAYFNARLVGDCWEQDYSEYDLANLPLERVSSMIRQGKAFLEEVLRPIKPDYRCIAFRAANWSMHPSRNLSRALVENGLCIDSSVFKHGRYTAPIVFDYRHAWSDLVPWPASQEDVCRRDRASRLFEFPIYCELAPVWVFLTANRVYRVVEQWRNPLPEEITPPPATDGAAPPRRGPLAKLGKLVGWATSKHPWKADFNQCTGQQLIAQLERAERKYGHLSEELPFVLIGHPKTFTRHNERSLRPFLERVERGGRHRFGLFGDFDLERFRSFST